MTASERLEQQIRVAKLKMNSPETGSASPRFAVFPNSTSFMIWSERNCMEVQLFLGNLSKSIMHLHDHPAFKDKQRVAGQHNEMHANLQLAFRHLEDAHHRLGKAIQASQAGPETASA